MRRLLATLFFLSGFAGLVYESVWAQYLRMLVGAAAYAQSLVLAVFMGGMALGAWWASRNTHRWANLLRSYAWAELALGLLGLAFHPIFVGAEAVLFGDGLTGAVWPAVATGLRWATAVFLILPQSFLLGMTFPLLAGGFVRRFPERPGAALAILYFVNALGGAVGVLVSGFVFIGWVGLPGTVMAAGFTNLAIATLMFWMCGLGEEDRPPATSPTAEPPPQAVALGTALLLVAGLAGFASFVYEIVWIRMLSLVLSNSAHAFELMLSAFILGIALGGLGIRGRVDRLAHPVRFLGRVQIAMGALAVATLPVYMALFPWMQHLMETLPRSPGGYLQFNLWSHGMALVVMLPATVCAGMTLPVLTYILLARGFGERSIGRVYGVNTIGAMLGAVLATQLLLPGLGLKGALLMGAGVNVVAGALLTSLDSTTARPWSTLRWATVGTGVIVAVWLLVSLDPTVLTSGLYRRYVDLAEARQVEVLAQEDGKTATVTVVRNVRGILSIRTNGKPSASIALPDTVSPTGDETVSTLLGALPLMLRPEARSALNIGMGSGLTSHVLLSSPELESVTTVEIEPAMVRLARHFAPRNDRVFTDPRSSIVLQDARALLAASRQQYDIIVTQPFNPWLAGAGALYSTEFYEVLADRLAPGGLAVQWIQLSEISPEVVTSILEALAASFPDFRAYAGSTGNIVIVASRDVPIPSLRAWPTGNTALTQDLAAVDIRTLQDVAIRTAGDQRTLGALMRLFDAPGNTEYHPYVERHAARARFMEAAAEEVLRLMVQPIPIMEMLGVLEPTWDESAATPAVAFFYSSRPAGAAAFRDLVVLGQEPSREGNAFARRARDDASRYQHDCAYQGFGQDALPAFYGVATSIVTDLRPAELDAVWRGMEDWSCVKDLQGDERLWLSFLQAVGRRDPAAIDLLVPQLLARPLILTPARIRYLVATGMVARVALGRPEEALALFEEFRSRLSEGSGETFLFRHLAELARMLADSG